MCGCRLQGDDGNDDNDDDDDVNNNNNNNNNNNLIWLHSFLVFNVSVLLRNGKL